MIAILPASIEQYLKDAKFSVTEILVIRKLLEEDALTLRELATKTGKSTGVLDQALKKLIGKGIVGKQAINGGYKYTMASLKPILEWMEKDMRQKYDLLERRHQNFEAFIESLSVDKARPELQYFDGEDGMKRAYIKLLEDKREVLFYRPMPTNWEEHPLRDFFVQYFRERHRRGIFSRVITHDTPFGRRFQSRDPFEYRKTMLVPADGLPIPFEKGISGDIVACFNYEKQQACFIKYPEFAHAERMLFENHWKEADRKARQPAGAPEEQAEDVVSDEPVLLHSPEIELRTKVFSQLRDFFLSKGSIVSFAVFLAVAGGITLGLYKQAEHMNLERMREKVEAIAVTAALQLDAEDMNALQVEPDWHKPQWAKVVHQLEAVRKSNPDLMYAYIVRQSKTDPTGLEFVSDSHSINPYANTDDDPTNDVHVTLSMDPADADHGVTSTGADYLQWPGQQYPDPPKEAIEAAHGNHAISNENFYTDQWGTMISGYAPIKDKNGKTVAAVAVDMGVSKLIKLNADSFSILYYLLGFFLLFIVIRFIALHRSLMSELMKIASIRRLLLSFLACAIIAVGGKLYLDWQNQYVNLQRLREQVKSIAATGALQFSAKDIDAIHGPDDIKKPEYARLIRQLNDIRSSNDGVQYAYIMRRVGGSGGIFTFVADADSIDPTAKKDLNGDGIIDQNDALSVPGDVYAEEHGALQTAWEHDVPDSDQNPATDQWGTFISGVAPIHDAHGGIVGIVGIDSLANNVHQLAQQTEHTTGLFLVLLLAFLWLNRMFILTIAKNKRARVAFCIIAGSFIASLVCAYSLSWYTGGLLRNERAKKFLAIAVTASTQIKSNELDGLRIARDMKTPQYQQVFSILQDIRSNNPDVKYAYILRRVDSHLTEFVADADSNYNLPFLRDDNHDGVLDQSDEAAAPGVRYYVENLAFDEGFFKPSINRVSTDQWGTLLTVTAPIYSKNEKYALGLDLDISSFDAQFQKNLHFWEWLIALWLLLLGLSFSIVWQHSMPQRCWLFPRRISSAAQRRT